MTISFSCNFALSSSSYMLSRCIFASWVCSRYCRDSWCLETSLKNDSACVWTEAMFGLGSSFTLSLSHLFDVLSDSCVITLCFFSLLWIVLMLIIYSAGACAVWYLTDSYGSVNTLAVLTRITFGDATSKGGNLHLHTRLIGLRRTFLAEPPLFCLTIQLVLRVC